VIYGHGGNLRSLGETPLVGGKLTKEDLDVFAANLDSELTDLGKAHPAVVAPPAPAPAPVAVPVARAMPAAPPRAAVAMVTPDDSESPPGLEAAPKPAQAKHEAAPVETASVSLDEIEEMTGGGGGSAPESIETQAPGIRTTDLRIHAAIGIGLAGRGFTPGPSTVTGYSTSPVGQARFEAGLAPTHRTTLDVVAERTLTMTTPLSDGMATTTMSRWEVTGGIVLHGPIEVTPVVGLGHRSFAIQSADPSRSPDNDYRYIVAGVRFARALGDKVTLRANAAFEPVFGGMEPTEMAFGDARRWAFAVGGALDVRPVAHVFARLAIDYQQFSWSWDDAGPRGAGGAVDSYPSGLVSLGAEY
jgi:hypothetical protein